MLARSRSSTRSMQLGEAPISQGMTSASPSDLAAGESLAASSHRRIRIAFEVESLDRGGLETVVYELARDLAKYSIDPLVICTERGGRSADELIRLGVPVEILRNTD